MQFVPGGPDIPEDLLQLHEEGGVVFFCGAGISCVAGLPPFGPLARDLFSLVGSSPNVALNNNEFDIALGHLENEIVDGRNSVRNALVDALEPDLNAQNALRTHKALLALSQTDRGVPRLVTTNFDRLFFEAQKKGSVLAPIHTAPHLPFQRLSWSGIVYLHGWIPKEYEAEDLDRLVLTSGDFGRAYLTERWAARFVEQLFCHNTVCFVGYSLADPILRYVTDAIAADRRVGDVHKEVFAFVGHDPADPKEELANWKAKGIIPILYDKGNEHSSLHDTLHIWASAYRDGALGMESIVEAHARLNPSTSSLADDFVSRVIWAVSDPMGLAAKRFAEIDPIPSIDWLEPFSQARFNWKHLRRFRVEPLAPEDEELSFSLLRRPTPYFLSPHMELVSSPWMKNSWDKVMEQLARWLSRHLNSSTLVLWIEKNGGQLPHGFARILAEGLASNKKVSRFAKAVWRTILSRRHFPQGDHRGLAGVWEDMKRGESGLLLRQSFTSALTPAVVFKKKIAFTDSGLPINSDEIDEVIHSELVIPTSSAHHWVKKLESENGWPVLLVEILEDVTSALCMAFDSLFELGKVTRDLDYSYIQHPSIEDHDQNSYNNNWTALITICRDAWLAAAAANPAKAIRCAERWWSIGYPVFRRLCLFAASQPGTIGTARALGWLTENEGHWLWAVETRREALRFLATTGQRLTSDQLAELEKFVLVGPTRRPGLSDEEFETEANRAIWLRLAKLTEIGVKLGGAAAAKFASLQDSYPNWKTTHDQSEEFPFWSGDFEEGIVVNRCPRDPDELLQWLRGNPKDTLDWGDLCTAMPPLAMDALVSRAGEGRWPIGPWRDGLYAWSSSEHAQFSWLRLRNFISAMPPKVISELVFPLASWLEDIGKVVELDDKEFLALCNKVLAAVEDDSSLTSDPLTEAINHPAGHVARALVNRWHQESLSDGRKLRTLKGSFDQFFEKLPGPLRHGRVFLAAHTVTFFRVDPDWTKENLLPLFGWSHPSGEALGIWQGFLWSPRAYGPLLEEIKPEFLAAAANLSGNQNWHGGYISILAAVSLNPESPFTVDELRCATKDLDPEGVTMFARSIRQFLEASGDGRQEYWTNRAMPCFKDIFPKQKSNQTPEVGEELALLAIAAGPAFTEALKLVRAWLRPIKYPGGLIDKLNESVLCGSHPSEVLELLELIVPSEPLWESAGLEICLESIRSAGEEHSKSDEFQRLIKVAKK